MSMLDTSMTLKLAKRITLTSTTKCNIPVYNLNLMAKMSNFI